MLCELFSWINSSETELLLSHQIATRSDVESEQRLALNKRRELLAEIHVARHRVSSTAIASDAPKRLEQHEAYIDFLKFCHAELGIHESISSFLLALKYLFSKDVAEDKLALNEAKINSLFFLLLKENKEKALEFYHENQSKFAKFKQVNLMVAVENTTSHLTQLTSRLRYQENSVSIVPLLGQFIDDDAEQFAAVILWFLRRGITTELILQTHLLQKFMAYHTPYLADSNNSVHQLYNLLAQFPEARPLVMEAWKVQSEVRGFDSYAITGVLCAPSTLLPVNSVIFPLEFTPTAENFDALYQLFGANFLIDALTWHARCENRVWHEALRNFLNRDATLVAQLPALINFVSLNSPPSVLKILASLIDEATINKLLARHCGAVLHLLPYKPSLVTKISASEVTHFLDEMKPFEDQLWDVIPQLLALFVACRDSNKDAAVLVYEVILDLVMQHSEFLDDVYLMNQLRRFSEAEVILTRRCTELQSQFDRCLVGQISTSSMTIENYHIIEDAWLGFSPKLNALKEILPIASRCPEDKYKLQAHVAKMYFAAHADSFILDDFIRALGVTPELLADGVNEYERILIELLAAIDSETIRALIIEKFETNEAKKTAWMNKEYGDSCLFDRGVKQGNVGLIHWLESRITFESGSIDRATKIAAEFQQWNMVDYFCSTSAQHPQQHVLKDLDLLNKAAKAGQLSTVRILCEGAITHLHAKNVEQALVHAAHRGHKNIVEYFCNLSVNAPAATVVARALKVAIQFIRPELIDFIGNLPENAQLLAVVERSLVEVATRGQLPIVQQLCALRTNVPKQEVIEEAFVRAIKSGHLPTAQFLAGLAVPLGQKVIDDAFGEAIANEYMPGVEYLCHLTTPPSQIAVERQLQQVVRMKNVALAEYLCTLSTTSPRPKAIETALQSATKSGHLALAMYLSSLVGAKVIEEVIQLAARHGKLDIVQHCCKLSPPNRKAMYDARKKATSNGHAAVVDYFTAMLAPPPVSAAASAAVDGAAMVPSAALPPADALPEAVAPPPYLPSAVAAPPHGVVPLRRAVSLGFSSNVPHPAEAVIPGSGGLRKVASSSALVRAPGYGFFSLLAEDGHAGVVGSIALSSA